MKLYPTLYLIHILKRNGLWFPTSWSNSTTVDREDALNLGAVLLSAV
jgi:hypothetical protein